MGNRRNAVIAVGLGASAVFVFLAVRHLDFASLERAFRSASLLPWLPLGIASYLLGHVVRGLRCRLLVRRTASLGLATASNIVVVGYASNNVLPARLGEFVRAGMLAERTGMPVVQSLAVTFIERVLDGLAILGLLVVGTATGEAPGWIHDLVRVALAVFGVATLVIFAGAHSPDLIVSGASRLGNKIGSRAHDRLVSLATSITNAGACLRAPGDAVLLILYSVVVWCLDACLFTAILPVFGLPISVQDGVVAMSVTNLGLMVPSSPGFIGPFHFFCSRALMAHGVPEPTALAYATLVHLALFVPITIWGAGAMLWYGIEVGSTAAITREAKRSSKAASLRGIPMVEIAQLSPPPAARPVSAFMTGLVESLLVSAPGQAPSPAAVTYAAAFVDGQIEALQPKLRFLFESGMLGFRIATRLRYLRGYCELSLATRYAWTRRWAEGRITLLRQLFKPVRATALLAYYDHDDVKRVLLAAEPAVPASRLVRGRDASARAADPAPGQPPGQAPEPLGEALPVTESR